MDISVIIPTLNGGDKLRRLLAGLKAQTLAPSRIVVIDSSSTDDTAQIARQFGCVTEIIPRESFDHGATRNRAADIAGGEILVFMTQDAEPSGENMLEKLTSPLREGRAEAAYARQLPNPDATPPEAFAREINYPAQSHIRTIDDLERLGVRTFFFSNVTSAITRQAFEAVGKFPENYVMNEDMLFCARLLKHGFSVAYQANAEVLHSHNYSLVRQFRRYFDIGAFMTQAGDELAGATTGSAGRDFVSRQLRFLLSTRRYFWFVRACFDIGFRYMGFKIGRCFKCLPRGLRRMLSMHPGFWAGR